ncbi:MAG: hypothetical protein RQ743_06980 [Bacteroidales bacterium]|nr:hypothetical protein [Bacteroidales bacterium]
MRGNTIHRRIRYYLLMLLCGFTCELAASCSGGTSFEKIFDLIYSQQFHEASLELDSSKNELDRWEYHILSLDLMWWEALSGSTREDYKRFESALDDYASGLKNARDPDKLEELITLSYSFRLEAIKGNLIPMMLDFLKINHLIQHFDTAGLDPARQEIFKIYLALFNIGKSKLLFNNSRIKEEAVEILVSNLDSPYPVYRTISRYFLSKIYLEVDPSPARARIYCEQLCSAYPTNKIFIYNLEMCKNPDL